MMETGSSSSRVSSEETVAASYRLPISTHHTSSRHHYSSARTVPVDDESEEGERDEDSLHREDMSPQNVSSSATVGISNSNGNVDLMDIL